MSCIEHPKVENVEEFIQKYKTIDKPFQISNVDNRFGGKSGTLKKCCDNCDYFAESAMDFVEGFCMKNVTNTLCGQYLENTYTFYCSYLKLRLNNE